MQSTDDFHITHVGRVGSDTTACRPSAAVLRVGSTPAKAITDVDGVYTTAYPRVVPGSPPACGPALAIDEMLELASLGVRRHA